MRRDWRRRTDQQKRRASRHTFGDQGIILLACFPHGWGSPILQIPASAPHHCSTTALSEIPGGNARTTVNCDAEKTECTWLLIKIEANCWLREVSVRARHNTRPAVWAGQGGRGGALSAQVFSSRAHSQVRCSGSTSSSLKARRVFSWCRQRSPLLTRATLRFFSPLSWSRAITRS